MLSKLKILITFTTSILLLVNSVVFADPVKRVLHISVAKAALDAGFIQAMVEEYNWIDPYLQIVIQSEGAIQALDQLRNGEADMTITHHEPEEKRLVSQKFGLHRTQLLYSEYALFGPRDMATNFSSSKDIIKILRELASQKVRFLEPSPRGGTYRKIRDLWTAAGVNPNWMGYENTGSSALSTLRQAADVKAFSMAEIGTFQSHQDELGEGLALIYRNDVALRNTYSVVVANPEAVPGVNATDANAFLEYLVSDDGQDFIRVFNDNLYAESVLKPAAHLDMDLRQRRAMRDIKEKNHNLKILAGLSTGSFLLLILCIIFARRLMIESHKRTESENLSKAYAKARDIAEQASSAKTNFLANMSHELRTPMNAIIGYSEILIEDSKESDSISGDYLKNIHSSGTHLLSLINAILDISKVEAGKIEIEKHAASIFDIVKDVKVLVEVQSKEKDLYFDINYQSPVPKVVMTDPFKLKRILISLCENAVKFTNVGGVKVNVICVPEKEILTFEIVDSGIGMTVDQIEKVFEIFEQADTSATRKYGGTGMGLALSKCFVELLGGTLSVNSRPGVGSSFTFTIATGSLEGVEYESVEDWSDVKFVKSSMAGNSDSLMGSVLVVEDAIENQQLISLYLRKMGVTEIEIAENGKIAVERALNKNFDVILMDIQMPVMGGMEATKILRHNGYNLPIISVTANDMNSNKEQYINAGFDDFVSKPINSSDLHDTLSKYLSFETEKIAVNK